MESWSEDEKTIMVCAPCVQPEGWGEPCREEGCRRLSHSAPEQVARRRGAAPSWLVVVRPRRLGSRSELATAADAREAARECRDVLWTFWSRLDPPVELDKPQSVARLVHSARMIPARCVSVWRRSVRRPR